jgi:arginine deiminase
LFPRDHFINVNGRLVFGRLKRLDRAREVDVVKKIAAVHGHDLIEVDWVIEGGDYHENEKVSVLNFGFRTEERTLHFLLESDLVKADTILAIEDEWHNPEQFHLDHYVCLLPDTMLIDACRADALDRSRVRIYRRTTRGWGVENGDLTLRQAAEAADLEPVLLDGEMMAAFCANSLSVDHHIWINEAAPAALLETLSTKGYDIHQVSFTEHQKQFGGIHCSTQFI